MSTSLRTQLIRLAHAHPEFRADILPLLKEAGTYQDYVQRKKQEGGKPLDEEEWKARTQGGKGDEGSAPAEVKKEEDKGKDTKPKKKVVPTSTNLFALWDEMKDDPNKTLTKVDAGRFPHLKRCLDAGLFEVVPGTKSIRLTEDGKRVFKEEDDKRRKSKEQYEESKKKKEEEEAAKKKKEEDARKSYKKSYPKPVTEVMDKHKLTDEDADAVRAFKKSKPTHGRPKSESQLMAEFMQKAKPEMKARMKDMTPKEFMAMLAAITEDDEGGKTAALRAGLIRIAHAHPEFRKDILPLLR